MPLSALTDHGANRAADLLAGIGHTGLTRALRHLLDRRQPARRLPYRRRHGGGQVPQLRPERFRVRRRHHIMCASSTSQALHAPLVVSLLDQIRSAVYRRRRWPATLFALDEVAQIAPLPDLASTIAEGGSQALVVMACLQDLSQLAPDGDQAPTGS